MTPPRARKCSRCEEYAETGYRVRGKWVCEDCYEIELGEDDDPNYDRFERARDDINEHNRGLGLE